MPTNRRFVIVCLVGNIIIMAAIVVCAMAGWW